MPLKSLRSFQQPHLLSVTCAHPPAYFGLIFTLCWKAFRNMNRKCVNISTTREWENKETPRLLCSHCAWGRCQMCCWCSGGVGIDLRRWTLTVKTAHGVPSWHLCDWCGLIRFSHELLRLCFLGSWNYWSHWEFPVLAGSILPFVWKVLDLGRKT